MSGCPNNRETNLQLFSSWYHSCLSVNDVPLFLALMHFYCDFIAVTTHFLYVHTICPKMDVCFYLNCHHFTIHEIVWKLSIKPFVEFCVPLWVLDTQLISLLAVTRTSLSPSVWRQSSIWALFLLSQSLLMLPKLWHQNWSSTHHSANRIYQFDLSRATTSMTD